MHAKPILFNFAGLADPRYATGALAETLGEYVVMLCRQKGIVQDTQTLRARPCLAPLRRLLRNLMIPVCVCLGLRVRELSRGGIIVGT